LTQLDVKVPGLESLRDLYATDPEFSAPYRLCTDGKAWEKYHIYEAYLFRANKLCVPESSVRLLLLQESHVGGLMGRLPAEMSSGADTRHMTPDLAFLLRWALTLPRALWLWISPPD
jgi:hypothetical protein